MGRKFRSMAAALAAAWVLLAPAPSAFAQDADYDPFAEGAFEEALGEDPASGSPAEGGTGGASGPAAQAEVARVEYLVGGTAAVRSDLLVRADGAGRDGYLASSSAAAKVFAKVSVPDVGAFYAAYALTHDFFRGAGGDAVPPPGSVPPVPAQPTFALSELHYSFDAGKVAFFRLGNQLLAWGPARIWAPADFVNREREDAFASFDARAGKSGLRVHVPFGFGNAFAFLDLDGLSGSGAYSDPLEAAALAGRLDAAAGGFEFGLSGYGGRNAQVRGAFDATGRLAGTTVYVEAAAAPAYADRDAWVQAAAGFSRALDGLRIWTLSVEGFYNSRGRDLSGLGAAAYALLPAAERTPLYQGAWYGWASLAASEFLSKDLSATLSGLANFSDLSYQAKLQATLSLPRAVPFTATLSYSGGGADKEFTRSGGDGAFAFGLSVRAEF